MTSKEKARQATDLIERDLPIEQMRTRADLLVKSGFLPKAVDTGEKAVAIMILAAEYGISPMKAFQSIDVIDGKPSLSAQLKLALCQQTGELTDLKFEEQESYCKVTMTRKNQSPFVSIFGDKQAKEMKAREWDYAAKTSRVILLIEKYNYKTMKSVMYRWRALSRACDVVFADVVLGLHTPDELEDVITQGQDHAIEVRAEIADQTVEKISEIDSTLNTGTVHDEQAEAEFMQKTGASFVQDPKWYNYYADRTIGEIYNDKTPGGKEKGIEFLRKVAESSSIPDDRANISKYLEIMGRPVK